jgi:hypothetical protein
MKNKRLIIKLLIFVITFSVFTISPVSYALTNANAIVTPDVVCTEVECFIYDYHKNLSVTHYSQTNSTWSSDYTYYDDTQTKCIYDVVNEVNSYGTIGAIGCLITSYTMISNYFYPTHSPVYKPNVVNDVHVVASNCGWNEPLSTFGLYQYKLFTYTYDNNPQISKSIRSSAGVVPVVKQYIDLGYLVILGLYKSSTTHSYHFIVVNGYRDALTTEGTVYKTLLVRDPSRPSTYTTLDYLIDDTNPSTNGYVVVTIKVIKKN